MKKYSLIILITILILLSAACSSPSSEAEDVETLQEANVDDIPVLTEVSLFAADGSQIMQEDGWYTISAPTKIAVRFDGEVEEIFFHFTPSGTETSGLREKIGYLSAYTLDSNGKAGFGYDSGSAEFIWDVPPDVFIGHLGIELINGTVARVEPNVLNITNERAIGEAGLMADDISYKIYDFGFM
jgi:hypothetical protein